FKEIRIYNECHIYSYPYKFNVYKNITNNFPGGLYKCVREMSLMDERPFEHEFFLRIAQSLRYERLSFYLSRLYKPSPEKC
ncbi:unnamed protein product, partial [Rotaria sp. Silwood2]